MLTTSVVNGNEGETRNSNGDRTTDIYSEQFPVLDNIISVGFYVKTFLSRPVGSKL